MINKVLFTIIILSNGEHIYIENENITQFSMDTWTNLSSKDGLKIYSHDCSIVIKSNSIDDKQFQQLSKYTIKQLIFNNIDSSITVNILEEYEVNCDNISFLYNQIEKDDEYDNITIRINPWTNLNNCIIDYITDFIRVIKTDNPDYYSNFSIVYCKKEYDDVIYILPSIPLLSDDECTLSDDLDDILHCCGEEWINDYDWKIKPYSLSFIENKKIIAVIK